MLACLLVKVAMPLILSFNSLQMGEFNLSFSLPLCIYYEQGH